MKTGEGAVPKRSYDALRAYLGHLDAPLVQSYLAAIPSDPPARRIAAAALPATALAAAALDRATDTVGGTARALAEALRADWNLLSWQQTYGPRDFQDSFLAHYGWVEMIGTRGHFHSDQVAVYILVLGPWLDYPAHAHAAEEVYIPLTGHATWHKGDKPAMCHAPGAVIHHPSRISHAMRTHKETLVALALWRGGNLAEKSTFALNC